MRHLARILAASGLALVAVAQPASAAEVLAGTTSVTLTAAPTLSGLGLSAGPTGSASVTVDGSGFPTFGFPITGGTIDDGTGAAVLFHGGSGILFSGGTSTLEIGNFVIDTNAALVSGNATANGSALGAVPLFSIGAGTSLLLTSEAAGAFTTVFGAPDLTGTNVGFATVAAAVPEPGTWLMMILGFGAIGYALRRRNSNQPTVVYA